MLAQRAQITLGLVGAAVVEEVEEGTCHTDSPPSQRWRMMDTSHLYEVGLARPGTGSGGQQVDLFLLRAVMTYGSVEGHGFRLPSPGELEQGCQTLSGKGQRVNIVSFAGHMFSVTAVLLYGSSTKPPQTFVSQRAWLGFRNTLAPIRH